MAEIKRVLKPGGVLCLAFGDRRFMQKLPFTTGFKLYDAAEAAALIGSCGYRLSQSARYEEVGQNNAGERINKLFHLMRWRV